MKTVIIGGGAAGASCAARLRRLDEKAEILILEKTNEISIANCGLPYYISDIINDREKILVSNPEKFKEWFNIDVRLNSEVIKIDRENKIVILQNDEKINYDKLVITTGSAPFIPDFKGIDKDNIFTLRTLNDADKIKNYIKEKNCKKAIIAGGGFIGIEIAENLIEMGLEVNLAELGKQILPPVDIEIAAFAQNEMTENGINLILSDGIKEFKDNKVILNSDKELEYDIAVIAIGVRPEIKLAKEAGLKVNRGIKVNEFLQTSDDNIYAAGDNIEVKDFISEEEVLIPLAGPANRQGRIIANNISNIKTTYKKTQGTSVIKIFNLTLASVGNNEKQLKNKNIEYSKTYLFARSHAGYYPNSTQTIYKLLFNKRGEILGAQAAGQEGVEKRIDVISAIMRNKGNIQDMIDAELCYAPPYSSAKDAINLLGMNADNILRGYIKPAYMEDIENSLLIDVRPEISFKTNTIKNAVNIPINEIRHRMDEIPKNKKVILFCNTGYTSYCASRILMQNGYNNVYSFAGGFELYKEFTRNTEQKVKTPVLAGKIESINNVFKIDATGMQCPGPIMKLSSTIENGTDGNVYEITVTDRGFKSDVAAWCESTGNSLLNIEQKDKKIIATIQKGSNITNKAQNLNSQTIVVFSDDLDKALASFIIANGAKAAGVDVTMFFTFWGLNILKKQNIKTKKTFIDAMFDFMMPKGADKLTLSKMNMLGIGSLMMKKIMKNKNILTLSELIKQAQKNNIKFIACNMSMDVMGIQEEELIEGVKIGGVAKYITESQKANSNLFI